MCGIVGYTGPRDAAPILLEGLARLEYRGYDSAGIALVDRRGRAVRGEAGRQARQPAHRARRRHAATRRSASPTPAGRPTAGRTTSTPTRTSTAPASSRSSTTASSRTSASCATGSRRAATGFASETDTEVLAHLVEEAYAGDLAEAVRAALRQAQGAYAVAVLHRGEPERLVGARHERAAHRRRRRGRELPRLGRRRRSSPTPTGSIFLEEGDVADLDRGRSSITGRRRRRRGAPGHRDRLVGRGRREGRLRALHAQGDARAAGGHSLRRIAGRLHRRPHPARRAGAGLRRDPSRVERVELVACGTAATPRSSARACSRTGRACRRAGTSAPSSATARRRSTRGRSSSRSPSRARPPTRSPRRAWPASAGCPIIAVTNTVGSAITREADAVLFLQAGPEIAVVATKTFVTQVTTLVILAAADGQGPRPARPRERARARGRAAGAARAAAAGARRWPREPRTLARRYVNSRGFMFVGRGITYPVALEGALKLKEVSYVHAEGYAAGELKHGPISLLDAEVPLVAIATRSARLRQAHQQRHGGPRPRRPGDRGRDRRRRGDRARSPTTSCGSPTPIEALSPILAIIPLQLFAYHTAVARGTDVDQPRNLAKSVTVE